VDFLFREEGWRVQGEIFFVLAQNVLPFLVEKQKSFGQKGGRVLPEKK